MTSAAWRTFASLADVLTGTLTGRYLHEEDETEVTLPA